jgi:hypothetical protein
MTLFVSSISLGGEGAYQLAYSLAYASSPEQEGREDRTYVISHIHVPIIILFLFLDQVHMSTLIA